MCISLRFCARAGWTPALACSNCSLAKAIRARQVARRVADAETVDGPQGLVAAGAAFIRELFDTPRPGRLQ